MPSLFRRMNLPAPFPSMHNAEERLDRDNEANEAGMRMRSEWAGLIRQAMEDAGISNETYINNAQVSLPEMSKRTCLLVRDAETGTGMLASSDEYGICVFTSNHCVNDDNDAAHTKLYFNYEIDWNL